MKLELKSISLKNFKGIKSLSIEFGQQTDIYGDNATGKTTIFDAFTWLLFDKDSLSKSNFGIKTLDKKGKVMHGLDHEVEALMLVDSAKLTLKKVYAEKWTKRQGSTKKIFTGHTTSYFINEVPVKKSEYIEKVSSLVNEKVFKLITDPRNFNEQIHWQDRRKLLLDICGEISDKDIIASDKKLAELINILGDTTLEDHKKIIKFRRSKINDELKNIPVRIDEVQAGKPDISDLDFEGIEMQLNDLRFSQNEKRQRIVAVNSGGQIAKHKAELVQIESEITNLSINHKKSTQECLEVVDTVINDFKGQLNTAKHILETMESDISTRNSAIEKSATTIQSLRDEWHKVDNLTFSYIQETACPTCGQALPESEIENARQTALEAFNLDKARRLEEITAKGKQTSNQLETLKQEVEIFVNDRKSVLEKIQDLETSIKDLQQKRIDKVANIEDITALPEFKELQIKAKTIGNSIQELRNNASGEVEYVQSLISQTDIEIDNLQKQLTLRDQSKKAEARIAELMADEEYLSKEFEQLEKELYLTELFTKSKVKLLDSKVSGMFKLATFKLFNEQVNGGIVECCETVLDGVPYSDLNNAARINVGVDIINTLAKHFNANAPIFIDNRESVTELIESNAQTINLIVSKEDKKLRVEVA